MLQTFGIHKQKAWEYANNAILSHSFGNNTPKGVVWMNAPDDK
jgi:hypothetical protein